MDLIGQKLGNYQIIETIGQGGMSSVYRAYQTSLNRSVAIKVLSTVHTRDAMFRQRFDREAKAVAQLSHPNIVPIYDFGNDERRGLLYLVMEYVAGGNLRDRAQRYLSIKDATNIIVPMAYALSYAHTRGIIHRDIKPSNILLTETRRPLLTDFGLAKLSDGTLSTESGFTIGTPAYMSPEQVMGENLDGRSDIYSLAMVFYELVTGRVAFQGETALAILHQQVYDRPITPRELNGRIARPLESVLLCALNKNRDERYRTGDEFAVAIESAMNEKGKVVAPTLPLPAAAPKSVADRANGEAPPAPEAAVRESDESVSFASWLLLTLVKIALITTIIAVVFGLGSAMSLAVFAERSIGEYNWNWTPLQAEQPTVVDDALVQGQVEQFARANVSDGLLAKVSTHFQANDKLELFGEGQGGRLMIETRVYVVGGALQVQIDEVNGLRPYILGSIVSDGVNRGLRRAFEGAPVKLDRIITTPGQLTLYPKRPGSAATPYPLPVPTVR